MGDVCMYVCMYVRVLFEYSVLFILCNGTSLFMSTLCAILYVLNEIPTRILVIGRSLQCIEFVL